MIGKPDDLISQESPFLHSAKPLLAHISNQHKFSLDEEGKERHHGNWHGLHIVNLESGSETPEKRYSAASGGCVVQNRLYIELCSLQLQACFLYHSYEPRDAVV